MARPQVLSPLTVMIFLGAVSMMYHPRTEFSWCVVLWGVRVQGSPFVHVGAELYQKSDFTVRLTQDELASNLEPLLASPELWAARQQLL